MYEFETFQSRHAELVAAAEQHRMARQVRRDRKALRKAQRAQGHLGRDGEVPPGHTLAA